MIGLRDGGFVALVVVFRVEVLSVLVFVGMKDAFVVVGAAVMVVASAVGPVEGASEVGDVVGATVVVQGENTFY